MLSHNKKAQTTFDKRNELLGESRNFLEMKWFAFIAPMGFNSIYNANESDP